MKVVGVHSVFFFVEDLERSMAFYREVLGIEPVQLAPAIASVDIGGVQLLLHADGDTPRVPPGSRRGAGVSIHIQVEGVHALWDRLRGLGISIPEKPTEQHGFTDFAIKDPDGYDVEFLEPA